MPPKLQGDLISLFVSLDLFVPLLVFFDNTHTNFILAKSAVVLAHPCISFFCSWASTGSGAVVVKHPAPALDWKHSCT